MGLRYVRNAWCNCIAGLPSGGQADGVPRQARSPPAGVELQCVAPIPPLMSPTEEETHPVDLSSLSSKLLPGFTTLGFKDERRNKGKCAEAARSPQNPGLVRRR